MRPYDLGAHYMEYFGPGLKFQSGAGLKFSSDGSFQLGSKNFSPVLFWFYIAGKFFGCLRKKYSMFFIYIWAMLHFNDVNSPVKCNNYYVWVIRKEKEICCESSLYMFGKKKWIQRQKFFRRHHLFRKPRSVWVTCGSTDEWWNNVKREYLTNTWGKRSFWMKCFWNLSRNKAIAWPQTKLSKL